MRLSEALDFGAKLVGKRDAMYVLQNVTGKTHEEVLIRGEPDICSNELAEFEQKIKRLTGGEPLQYVLGKWDFCGIEFIVDRRALIPRPETELLVEAVLDYAKGKRRLDILDVCTGSGCIGLSIAKLTGFRHNVVLSDISDKALSLARENCLHTVPRAEQYPCSPGARGWGQNSNAPTGQVSIFQSDLLDQVTGEFDIIVSNPPYITTSDMKTLPDNVKNFEPHLALDGGADGLDIYKRLIPESFEKLKPGGMIFLEIGPTQAIEIMQESCFTDIKIQKDYAGIDRILSSFKN